MPNPTLVARIGQLTPVSYAGEAYRHLAPGYSPYSGEGARALGGRWNPPNSFPVLYLALDVETVTAELFWHAARTGMRAEDLLPRLIYRYELQLTALLDLRGHDALAAVGLDTEAVRADDLVPCQAVGDAAHFMGLEGILASSAAGMGNVLAVSLDKLRVASNVEVLESEGWNTEPR